MFVSLCVAVANAGHANLAAVKHSFHQSRTLALFGFAAFGERQRQSSRRAWAAASHLRPLANYLSKHAGEHMHIKKCYPHKCEEQQNHDNQSA
jgi:hypothetical protein